MEDIVKVQSTDQGISVYLYRDNKRYSVLPKFKFASKRQTRYFYDTLTDNIAGRELKLFNKGEEATLRNWSIDKYVAYGVRSECFWNAVDLIIGDFRLAISFKDEEDKYVKL